MYPQRGILALIALLASTALAVCPTSALADGDDDYYEDEYADDSEEAEEEEPEAPAEEVSPRLRYARSGVYMYVGGAYVIEHVGEFRDASNTGAVNIRFGARFKKYFAVEFEYQTAPQWEFDVTLPQLLPPDQDSREGIDVHSFTLNAKFYYPAGRFQPFGQIGAGLAGTDSPGSKFTAAAELRFGGGIETFVTENIAVGVAAIYTLPFGDLEDLKYTSLVMSVGYHF